MKVKIRTLFFSANILLLLLFLTACSDDQPLLPHLQPGDTIVALGDSLTFGIGANPESSYPAELEKLTGFRVINSGVVGETTEGSIKRLPMILQQYKPALVILCIGGNDLLRRVPQDIIANNLRSLISTIKRSGASVVLIAVPQPNLTLSVPNFYEEIAKGNDIPVDTTLLRRLLREYDYKSDTIHLNAAGYHAFAEGVSELLKKSGAID